MTGNKTEVALVLRSGGCYNNEYVIRLVKSLKKHITVPHQITILTDFETLDVPSHVNVLPLKKDFTGWWSKLELFDNFKNKTVYLDLDTIVNGNIDWLVRHDTPFMCLTDLLHPQFFATGVMAWNGDFSYLSDGFDMSMDRNYRQTGNWGDQGYIIKTLNITPQSIQQLYPKQITSYKQSAMLDKEKSSIVCYHGNPRPHETGWVI
jgi:hypothetical protein